MGYHADFQFDIKIPAEKVEEAEQALADHFEIQEQIRRQRYEDRNALENYESDLPPRNIVQCFTELWNDIEAEEEKVAPLVALASGTVRGDVYISGYVNKKWRDWEEPMLEVIAPFVKAGSSITVKGEDDDCSCEWRFNGEAMIHAAYSAYEDSKIDALMTKCNNALDILWELRHYKALKISLFDEAIDRLLVGHEPKRVKT